MRDLIALAVSYLYVFAFIGAASLLLRAGRLSPSATRKVVHIGVSHWWILYLVFGASTWVGVAGAGSFILINYLSWRLHFFKAMEDPQPRRNLGTVYFPVSLLVLVFLASQGVVTRWEAGVGVMIMGWGDGMAALVGQRWGKTPVKIFGQSKSIPGTLALIGASMAATAVMTLAFDPGAGPWTVILRSVAVALFAALVELITPAGLDNITIPILVTLFYRFVAEGPLVGPFAAAATLNAIVAFGAFRSRAVDASGAAVGAAVGTAILTAGGIPAYALLAGFFLSSTAVGRLFAGRRAPSGIEAKGGRRDALQVLANCGAGAVASFLYAITKDLAWLAAFATSFAAANADTWASEIGVLYRKLPRSILSGRELPAGASGGVTPLGFIASGLGAAFIGLVFAAAYGVVLAPTARWGLLAVIAAAGGFCGSLIDSVLGAALQAQYTCSKTGRYTERPVTDGMPNILVRGYRWVTNDAVNLLSTVAATALAAGAYIAVR
jgi:uncharacterized protein (TIGR00297 family)